MRVLLAVALLGGFWLASAEADGLQKKGTVIGVVTAKDKNSITIKGDGEEAGRRYMPAWIGNASGGLDKNILKAIADTPLNARVKIEWGQDERPRVLKIELLKAPDKNNGDKK
jgi:hypothetical protein